MRLPQLLLPALLGSFCLASGASAQIKVDKKLPVYTPTKGVSGQINSVGSDTMNNLMALWGEGFKKHYSQVQIEVTGKGSSTAPPALIKGQATFGPMSRAMKSEEVDTFKKAFGYEPIALASAVDTLVVYVHKDNPIQSLTLQQLDGIFSKTRKGGGKVDITTWGQLGLTGEWADKPISVYGRNSASGTYGFFKSKALFKGDFKNSVKEQAGSASVVQGVSNDRYSIGYSGVGFKTAGVRAVPIRRDEDSEAVEPILENAYSGKYPLGRLLYIYVNKEPKKELDPLRREFVRYVFSRDGQSKVSEDGYYPLPAKIVAKELRRVGMKLPKVVEAGSEKKKS